MRLSLVVGVGLLLGVFGWSPGDEVAALEQSLAKWEKARDRCGGNYQYKVAFTSFTGAGNETEIVVRNNEVVERRYRELGGPPVAPPVAPDAGAPEEKGPDWVEQGKEIGKNQQGAAAKTVDQLYAEAKVVAARDLAEFEKRYMQFGEDGLLRSCFIVDTRIADDAPRNGVVISSIELKEADGDAEAKVYRSPSGKAFPAHWGAPPKIQTRDYRPLPDGYGNGSGTLLKWIQEKMKADARKQGE